MTFSAGGRRRTRRRRGRHGGGLAGRLRGAARPRRAWHGRTGCDGGAVSGRLGGRHRRLGRGRPRRPGVLGVVAEHRRRAAAAERRAAIGRTAAFGLRLGRSEFAPPLVRPGKVLGIGLNYKDHAEETGKALPTAPMFFNKFATSLVGHEGPSFIPGPA